MLFLHGESDSRKNSSKGRSNTKDTSNHLRLAFSTPKTDHEIGGVLHSLSKDTMGQTVSLFKWSSCCTCTLDTWLSTICMLSYRYLPNTSLETTEMSWFMVEVFNSGKFYKSF